MNKILHRSTTLLTLLLLASSTTTFAAVITYGSYTHDTDTNIVIGDGLEWLQWDVTVGESIDSIQSSLNTLEGGGWTVASNVQMANLFNNFDFGLTFDDDENTGQFATTGIQYGTETGADVAFVSMFGDTNAAGGNTSVDYGEGGYHPSSAYFGHDIDGDLQINMALVYDDYGLPRGGFTGGRAYLTNDLYYMSNAIATKGIALVRSDTSIPTVAEPSAIALMGLGILGLGAFRRNKKKNSHDLNLQYANTASV